MKSYDKTMTRHDKYVHDRTKTFDTLTINI